MLSLLGGHSLLEGQQERHSGRRDWDESQRGLWPTLACGQKVKVNVKDNVKVRAQVTGLDSLRGLN